jgi:D-proline reductase (dithiol) PrdB
VEVDSFKYVSRLVTRYYKLTSVEAELPIPWTPLARPLSQSSFGLVTSGGLYHKDRQPPFDLERERREPTWGDPTFRIIPADIDPVEVGASHFHINTDHVEEDMNILLPVQRFKELAAEGRIQGQADYAYSFMGYQGFPADLTGWRETYGPQVAEKLTAEEVDCVLLTAA